nr:MFS transporter [Novosphingobium flavum]
MWAAIIMAVLDGSVMNLALPIIARDFTISSASTTWLITSYQIAIVMGLLPLSALGERFGYHQVYCSGLAIFVVASIGCAVSTGIAMLAGFRFVQGLGAAAIMAVNGAQMRLAWPSGLLSRGIGYNAVIVAGTAAAGPPLAGLLLSFADWPLLFLVNLPIGLASLLLVTHFGLRRPAETSTFDGIGALLNAVSFGAIFLGCSELVHGAPQLRAAGFLLVGLLLFLALLRRSARQERPMLPIDLFRFRRLAFAYGASVCAFAAQMCLLLALPFLLVDTMRVPVAAVGLLLLPLPAAIALSSPLAARLADRRWAGLMSGAGLALAAIAMGALAFLADQAPPLSQIAAIMALCGAGYGLFQSPNNNVMLRTAPLERAGAAAGMQATCRVAGQTVGALIAALALHLPQSGPVLSLYAGSGLALIAALIARGR